MPALPRYRPSGSFAPSTLLYVPLGALGAALLAWPYTSFLRWIPFIQLNFLLTAGFAGALAGLGYLALHAGHCRSRLLGLATGLVIGTSGLGASYGWAYKHALANVAEAHPEASAAEIAQAIPFQRWVDARIESGWRIGHSGKSDVTGWGVILFWILEGLLFLGAALYASKHAASEPFCERCQSWTVDRGLVLHGHPKAAAQAPLDAGDLDGVLGLPELTPDQRPQAAATKDDPVLSLKLAAAICPKCRESGWLTVKALRSFHEKGKLETKEDSLVEHATLDGSQTARFLARVPEVPLAAPS